MTEAEKDLSSQERAKKIALGYQGKVIKLAESARESLIKAQEKPFSGERKLLVYLSVADVRVYGDDFNITKERLLTLGLSGEEAEMVVLKRTDVAKEGQELDLRMIYDLLGKDVREEEELPPIQPEEIIEWLVKKELTSSRVEEKRKAWRDSWERRKKLREKAPKVVQEGASLFQDIEPNLSRLVGPISNLQDLYRTVFKLQADEWVKEFTEEKEKFLGVLIGEAIIKRREEYIEWIGEREKNAHGLRELIKTKNPG